MKAPEPKPKASSDDSYIVPPPANVTVVHSYVPVLYLPDGKKKALIRRAGF